jgi:hypothetical protein
MHSQFSRFREDGFEVVGRDPLNAWLNPDNVPPGSILRENVSTHAEQLHRRNQEEILSLPPASPP